MRLARLGIDQNRKGEEASRRIELEWRQRYLANGPQDHLVSLAWVQAPVFLYPVG